jgi:hypothetical protein
MIRHKTKAFLGLLCLALALFAAPAWAQKVTLNPSDQVNNAVSGGGNEAQYALILANLAKPTLTAAGLTVKVDQDFYNAPKNANSWGSDIFVSMHTNAGGGHGTESLYSSNGDKILAGFVQTGLMSKLPYVSRGLKYRTDLHVLNSTTMDATLEEAVFHDCTTTSAATAATKGHPPGEAAFLKSSDGQGKIANGVASGICSFYKKTCGNGTVTPPAPTGLYKGIVYKAPDTKAPIAGATVKLSNGDTTTASSTGFFQFSVPAGTYTATASAAGYAPNSSTKAVVAGAEIWGSIGLSTSTPVDTDKDGVADASDNCPTVANPDQKDYNSNGKGDACDPPPPPDTDKDGVIDSKDNCPLVANADQKDYNSNGKGDACDPPPPPDGDGDGVIDSKDNCPAVFNPDQGDYNSNGKGDACDPPPPPDSDKDGIADAQDNCPLAANPDQKDYNGNGQGDACDPPPPPDSDSDGIADSKDNCPAAFNPDQTDYNNNGKGDACDAPPPPDFDQDGIVDGKDNCPSAFNPDQSDYNNNGKGDACDPKPATDSDIDGVADAKDNCPMEPNADQLDSDGDGKGDACDPEAPDAQVDAGEDDSAQPVDVKPVDSGSAKPDSSAGKSDGGALEGDGAGGSGQANANLSVAPDSGCSSRASGSAASAGVMLIAGLMLALRRRVRAVA